MFLDHLSTEAKNTEPAMSPVTAGALLISVVIAGPCAGLFVILMASLLVWLRNRHAATSTKRPLKEKQVIPLGARPERESVGTRGC